MTLTMSAERISFEVVTPEVLDDYVANRRDRLAAISVERAAYVHMMRQLDTSIDKLDSEAYQLKWEIAQHDS